MLLFIFLSDIYLSLFIILVGKPIAQKGSRFSTCSVGINLQKMMMISLLSIGA